jgi:hypothetical protein
VAQNDLDRARTEIAACLAYFDQQGYALSNVESPFQIYLNCYHVLNVLGDARAEDVLTAACNLLQERAANTTDETRRRSFLENIPAHRELAALWLARTDQNRSNPHELK